MKPPRAATQQDIHVFLNQLLAAIFIMNTLDELEGSNLYSQQLKLRGKPWIKEVTALINRLSRIGDADYVAFYELQDHFTELFAEMCTLKPDDLAGLKDIIKIYKANPEAVMNANGIGILQKEENYYEQN